MRLFWAGHGLDGSIPYLRKRDSSKRKFKGIKNIHIYMKTTTEGCWVTKNLIRYLPIQTTFFSHILKSRKVQINLFFYFIIL